MRYFITFSCYGTHLHGADAGSVDRTQNLSGSRLLEVNPKRAAAERERMDQAPYLLDQERREMVLQSIREVCLHQGWNLLAAHVRTNHVHLVMEADVRPERAMNAFKSYASGNLYRLGLDTPDTKRWARLGSTRSFWKEEDVNSAIHYVVMEQGEPMAVFAVDRV